MIILVDVGLSPKQLLWLNNTRYFRQSKISNNLVSDLFAWP